MIRLNGIGGVTFRTRIELFDPGFFVEALQRHVIPIEVEESLIVFSNAEAKKTDMFRFEETPRLLQTSMDLKIRSQPRYCAVTCAP